jgi:putative transposase
MSNSPLLPGRGTSELRKGRFSGQNQIYHISTATVGREPIFVAFQHARMVIQSVRREDLAGNTETLAFVVMPDHLHWLLRVKAERSLSVCVNTMKSFATRSINRCTGRHGKLWQKGFYDRAIRREEDLVSIARYIVANPLRAGIVKSVREYPHWDAVWL